MTYMRKLLSLVCLPSDESSCGLTQCDYTLRLVVAATRAWQVKEYREK